MAGPRAEDIAAELQRRYSIRLAPQWVAGCIQALQAAGVGDAAQLEAVWGQALCADLSVAGAPCLPEALNGAMHKQLLQGRFILQIDEVVNMAAPAKERYSATPFSGRCLKLHLTDGTRHVCGIEFRPLPGLHWDCPAGCKLLVENVMVRRGVLLLQPENCSVLGGQVASLEAARQRAVTAWNKPAEGRGREAGPRDVFGEARTAAWAVATPPPAPAAAAANASNQAAQPQSGPEHPPLQQQQQQQQPPLQQQQQQQQQQQGGQQHSTLPPPAAQRHLLSNAAGSNGLLMQGLSGPGPPSAANASTVAAMSMDVGGTVPLAAPPPFATRVQPPSVNLNASHQPAQPLLSTVGAFPDGGGERLMMLDGVAPTITLYPPSRPANAAGIMAPGSVAAAVPQQATVASLGNQVDCWRGFGPQPPQPPLPQQQQQQQHQQQQAFQDTTQWAVASLQSNQPVEPNAANNRLNTMHDGSASGTGSGGGGGGGGGGGENAAPHFDLQPPQVPRVARGYAMRAAAQQQGLVAGITPGGAPGLVSNGGYAGGAGSTLPRSGVGLGDAIGSIRGGGEVGTAMPATQPCTTPLGLHGSHVHQQQSHRHQPQQQQQQSLPAGQQQPAIELLSVPDSPAAVVDTPPTAHLLHRQPHIANTLMPGSTSGLVTRTQQAAGTRRLGADLSSHTQQPLAADLQQGALRALSAPQLRRPVRQAPPIDNHVTIDLCSEEGEEGEAVAGGVRGLGGQGCDIRDGGACTANVPTELPPTQLQGIAAAAAAAAQQQHAVSRQHHQQRQQQQQQQQQLVEPQQGQAPAMLPAYEGYLIAEDDPLWDTTSVRHIAQLPAVCHQQQPPAATDAAASGAPPHNQHRTPEHHEPSSLRIPVSYARTQNPQQLRSTSLPTGHPHRVLLCGAFHSSAGDVAVVEDGTGLLNMHLSNTVQRAIFQGYTLETLGQLIRVPDTTPGAEEASRALQQGEQLLRSFHGLLLVQLADDEGDNEVGVGASAIRGQSARARLPPVLLALRELRSETDWEDVTDRLLG